MPHPGNDQLPASYGQDYATTLLNRWNAALGQYMRQFVPQVFGQAPPEAFVGFTTIGGQTEDTCSAGNSFHEMGYLQTEGGPCSGPGPNPDPNAADNNWGKLASGPTVTSLLGRSASMVAGAWQQAIDDQTAVGLANLQGHAAGVTGLIDPGLASSDPGSTWNAFLAFTGFSAGDSGAATTINRYADQLAGVPEQGRVAALIDAVLADAQSGTLPGPTGGDHGNPAYDVLRTLQKFGAGRALAQQTGGNAAWFDLGFGDSQADAEQAIDDAAYGRTVQTVPTYNAPAATVPGAAPSLATLVGWALIAGVAGATGWYGWRYYQATRSSPAPVRRTSTARRVTARAA